MLVRFLDVEKTAEPTLYLELGLACFADIKLVKKAYYQLALIHHPDKGGDENQFKRIGHAYYVLGNEERKAEYDDLLRNGQSTTDFTMNTSKEFDDQTESFVVEMRKEFKSRDLERTNIKSSTQLVPSFNHSFHPARQLKQLYYIVGKPINVSARAGELHDQIPAQEILDSFQDLDQVILFEDAYQASNYAWSTRQGNFYDDETCYQSAVATVKILRPVAGNPYQLECWINERYNDQQDGATKSASKLICLDAHMSDIELISAKMIIQTAKRGYFWKEFDAGEFANLSQKRIP